MAWLDDEFEPYEIQAQEVDSDGFNYGDEFFLAAPAHQYNAALAYNAVSDNTLLAYSNAPNRAVGFLVTPDVPPANLNLSVSEGTTGTEIEISGEGFGTKKGKVLLSGSEKPVALKVLSWNEAGSGVIRAVISKAPPAGVYDVSVVPAEPKGAAAIIEEDGFEIMAPEITACPGSGYIEQASR